LDLYPTYHPTGEVQVLQKAWKLLSDDAKTSLQRAESNLNALNIVDLEQTARAISAHAQCACLFSFQMGSVN
jgi:hypothetical protein